MRIFLYYQISVTSTDHYMTLLTAIQCDSMCLFLYWPDTGVKPWNLISSHIMNIIGLSQTIFVMKDNSSWAYYEFKQNGLQLLNAIYYAVYYRQTLCMLMISRLYITWALPRNVQYMLLSYNYRWNLQMSIFIPLKACCLVILSKHTINQYGANRSEWFFLALYVEIRDIANNLERGNMQHHPVMSGYIKVRFPLSAICRYKTIEWW